MREIWRKTVELFWEHPVLWLPYSVAQLMALALDLFSNWTARTITRSLITSYSVLGGETTTYTHSALSKALAYSLPISATIHFASVCTIVVSFLLIAHMSQSIIRTNDPDSATAFAELKKHPGRILWFSFKFCLCMVAATSIAAVDTIPPALATEERFGIPFEVVNWVCLLAAMIAVGWVTAPMALRLLRDGQDRALSSADVSRARQWAMMAAAGSGFMSLAYNSLRHQIRAHSAFEGHAIGALATLVGNSPLLLLFIALAVLANKAESSENPVPLPAPEPLSPG